ncbi:MAG: hypothetical protein IIB40_07820 [Candidatus Marinimicrobia bacterium]|nr:hypothetical protein [Candidatus Neomarinimicrobiota bacterium]
MAEIYTLTGDYEKAIDELEYLLSIPAPISESSIRYNTIFLPLKNNTRFQKIINRLNS